jgi:hypothetical protein
VKMKLCPFAAHSKCSDNSWANAFWWSFLGCKQTLKYCMQHATQSPLHALAANDAYNILLEKYAEGDLSWEIKTEVPKEREEYREETLKELRKKERNSGKGGGKGGSKGGSKRKRADISPDDSASNIGSHADDKSTFMQQAIQQGLAHAMRSMSQVSASSRDQVDWASVGIGAIENLASSSSPMNLSLPGDTVDVPMEKLKLVQDSLGRAECAISSTLHAAILNCQKLSAERKIVINAINIISKITGEAPSHFQA